MTKKYVMNYVSYRLAVALECTISGAITLNSHVLPSCLACHVEDALFVVYDAVCNVSESLNDSLGEIVGREEGESGEIPYGSDAYWDRFYEDEAAYYDSLPRGNERGIQ